MKLERYTVEQLMDMHVIFSNKVMAMVDNSKRFVHYPKTQEVATERKRLFGWKESSRLSYEEVFREDFSRSRKEV